MAATSLAEQQLAEIPLLKDGRPTNASGSSLIKAVLEWLQRGVQAAFCVLDTGAGGRVVFLGEDRKLFEVQRPANAEAGDADMPTAKEIFHGHEAWKLPDGLDLSAVCITSTSKNVFVVDSEMRLFSEIAGQGLSRCLPNHHVAQVACGFDHVLVLTTDGKVRGAGVNSTGQLGLGDTTNVAIAEMKPINLTSFATSVACGAHHSVVILCNGKASCFGFIQTLWGPVLTPTEMVSPVGPLVKAACGASHTLFLTAKGRLAGFGLSNKNQLGKVGNTCGLKEMVFEREKGRPVDIFCHPKLDASVVLTEADELFVCGDVGSLFNLEQPIPSFLHYQKPAVILGGRMVCMRPPTQTVMIPGFNDPKYCDIEVVSTYTSGNDPTGQFAPPGDTAAALDLAAKLPKDRLRGLVEHAMVKGELLPQDVHREYLEEFHPSMVATSMVANSAGPAVQPEPESVFIGLDAIRARSPHLKTLLGSELQGNISQMEDRKTQVRLAKYPLKVFQAYGRYIHEDLVVTDATGAIELMELGREYMDENGLPEQCARVAKRLVREKDLPVCLRKCIELRHMALAVELVKLQLSLKNCCDVLQVAEMGSREDPHADYIRNIAMEFALANATAVVRSPRFEHMDSTLGARLCSKMAEKNLLQT